MFFLIFFYFHIFNVLFLMFKFNVVLLAQLTAVTIMK